MTNFIDPDRIAADQEEAAHLRQIAALAGEFYMALRAMQLPDELVALLVQDWHYNYISDGEEAD